MTPVAVPTAQTAPQSAELFAAIQSKFGMLPNLFATIGYSDKALKGVLEMQGLLAQGKFNLKEREAIYLVTSEVNACSYCLAAHTAILGMNKVDEAETIAIRRENPSDPKLRAIVRLAADIARKRGKPDAQLVDEFLSFGYDTTALVELTALVGEKTLVNYVHGVTQIPVDFPAAKPLAEAVAA